MGLAPLPLAYLYHAVTGIHLGQHNLGLLLGENAGCLGVLRGQS